MSDVGRRFRATRVLELDIVLDEHDVHDQIEHSETVHESATRIAGSTPIADWHVVGTDVLEVP